MITALHQVFGRKYQGLFKIPYFDVTRTDFIISTRSQNLIVKKLDGSTSNYTTSKLVDTTINNATRFTSTYGSALSGDIEFTSLGGNSDIYSLALGGLIQNTTTSKLNIQDFGTFIKQFTNLYSYTIDYYCYFENTNKPIIKGDLADIPPSVERIRLVQFDVLNNSTDVYFNFNSLPVNSKLKYFNYDNIGTLKFIGDLAKLPISCAFFKTVIASNTSSIYYTSGKVWASSFDTLDLGNASLSATETDNLFNDMANSITTAIGSKVIRLAYCYRTSASDTSAAYLQSLGFTITVFGVLASANKILDLPLQNNFTDTTGINTMIAGGTSNLPTFTLEGSEYASTFNGSQSLKTNANFNIGTDKVSISFWIKTSQTAIAIIAELSSVFDNNNSFAAYINSPSNRITIADHTSIYNRTSGSTVINNNNWHHVVLITDRSLGTNQTSVYINNNLVTVVDTAGDLNGNFGSFPLFIGQRGGSSLGFNGQLKFLKIFNYPLSPTEITNLYNKTM